MSWVYRIYNVFTRAIAGIVPAPGGSGTTRFLREDGTWATAGSGSTPTLEEVTTAGATTDQMVSFSAGVVMGGSVISQLPQIIFANLGTFKITDDGGPTIYLTLGSNLFAVGVPLTAPSLSVPGALGDGTYPTAGGGSITITNGVITAIS